MYGALARAAIYTPGAAFLAFILSKVLAPLVDVMEAGDHAADAPNTIGYFAAMTEQNILLVFCISLGLMLLGRAAVEARLGV